MKKICKEILKLVSQKGVYLAKWIGYYEDEVNRYADNNNERDNEKEDEPLEFYDNKHLNGGRNIDVVLK